MPGSNVQAVLSQLLLVGSERETAWFRGETRIAVLEL